MKHAVLIFIISISFISANVLASDYNCKTINGTIRQLSPDPACTNLSTLTTHFPDASFLGICFSSSLLQGTIGTAPFTGTSYSGLTANGIGQLTAATVIRLNASTGDLGRLYTQDVIIYNPDPNNTREYLTVVQGTRMFGDGRGHLEITGDATRQDVTLTGVLCIEN